MIVKAKADTTLASYIRLFEGLLSDSLCDRIISEYDNNVDLLPCEINGSEDTGYITDDTIRNSEGINISHNGVISLNPETRGALDTELFNCVTLGLDKYTDLFPYLAVGEDSGYNFLKYKPGCFYKEHVDSFARKTLGYDENGRPIVRGCRDLSCVIQLNDNFEGGGLSFFGDTYRVPVVKGSIVYFPSGFMYPHQALPVTKGVRFSMVSWFH